MPKLNVVNDGANNTTDQSTLILIILIASNDTLWYDLSHQRWCIKLNGKEEVKNEAGTAGNF